MVKERFDITGMTCSACSHRVHKAVEVLPGVSDVNVNLLKNSLVVSFDDTVMDSDGIVKAVEEAGYGAARLGGANPVETKPPDTADREAQAIKQSLIFSFIFTVPLFYISMGHMAGLPLPGFLLGPSNALAFAFTQFLLTVPVMFINFKYYRIGFKTLFSGAPNMDSLIAIGSGAAAVFGIFAIYKISFAFGRGDMAAVHHFSMNLYFESTAMILTLITLGKFFEARAKGKTSEAIAKLMNLAPRTATVRRDGVDVTVLREAVLVGDTVVVKAGESVPVDGVIIEGSGFLDESALTGESLPLEKSVSDLVTGATINKVGFFLMRATRVGDDTALAQIVRLVDEATSSKAPIARLADKISGIFVPLVMTIALTAAAVWLLLGYDLEFALSIGISVLIISCPCALGLATPTAIMVGVGRGAADGILFKSAESIETAQGVNTVVLDKTGTITEGHPALTDIIPASGRTEEELLVMAASLEKLSEHPLGLAIVREAEKRGLVLSPVDDFCQKPGLGLTGRINASVCLAGNAKMMQAEAPADASLLAKGDELASDGKTPLYFAKNGELLGLIAVADVIRKNSRQAVAELKALGLEVIMLTGDNAKTAAAVQRQTGIETVLAEVLPQDKEREIRLLQTRGKKVAMVGDGINDAPALVRADMGIAIGAGADIAVESADVVLLKSDLLDVVSAVKLSRAVMRNIRQNLFWAFFYNIVGIPLAAGVFYGFWGLTLNPMIAAAAMSFSSVSVVSNALRLRFFKSRVNSLIGEKNNEAPTLVSSETTINERIKQMKTIINIEGMSCKHCTGSVEKLLRAIDGVTDVAVDLASKTATVESDENVLAEVMEKAVTSLDFTVTSINRG